MSSSLWEHSFRVDFSEWAELFSLLFFHPRWPEEAFFNSGKMIFISLNLCVFFFFFFPAT